ncbi:hypothetical protein GCM10023162_36230 [Klenkia terrae]
MSTQQSFLLRRASTAERVAEILRRRVTEGDLPPGSQLSEEQLSAVLQVSRNTLREAFRLLGHEGLLVHRLHRGVFVTELSDDELADGLLGAGGAAGEPWWRMPLGEEHVAHLRPQLDSPVADANNAPGNPGATTAALFLQPFSGDLPWAHLDIAGPARAAADHGGTVKGPTGFAVATLLRWLEGFRPPAAGRVEGEPRRPARP